MKRQAIVVTLLCCVPAAHSDIIWTRVARDIQTAVNTSAGVNEDAAYYFLDGDWSDSVHSETTFNGDFTSVSATQHSSVNGFGIDAMFGSSVYTEAQKNDPYYFLAISRLSADFDLTTDTSLRFSIDMQHNLLPTSGYAILTFDLPDGTRLISEVSSEQGTIYDEQFFLSAGSYTINYWHAAYRQFDSTLHESTSHFQMTVVPTPTTLAALTPLSLLATRRRR